MFFPWCDSSYIGFDALESLIRARVGFLVAMRLILAVNVYVYALG